MIALLTGSLPNVGEDMNLSGVLVVSAAPSTQEKIEQLEKDKLALQEKDKENDKTLSGLKGEAKELQKELDELNSQMQEVVERLTDLEEQIMTKESEISDATVNLEDAQGIEEWYYRYMIEKARYMYENKEKSYLNALLKERNLSKVLNTADYIEKVAAYDRQVMDEYTSYRMACEEMEAKLQVEREELEVLKSQTKEEEAKIDELISKVKASLNKYKGQISDAEKRAKEYEEELKKAEKDLKYLKKKLEEEMTLSQLAANSTWRDISQVTFAEGDRKLMANIIYCEAGGEPYEGKLAVGSVIMNRVLSSRYPDTVTGVVYQKSQFSPASSGRLALALASDKATAACYQAADEAMGGKTNVGTCVYFRRPVEGLTGITIGGHIFY